MKFKEMYDINVSVNVEKKGKFNYLSWAHAWKWFVEQYPTATYKIVKDENNNCYFGNKEVGYMVYTTVTVEELTHEMWLPVMNHSNKAITTPSMMDINKAVMRCLVKNLAMFGLGLSIYAGEDLPEPEKEVDKELTLARESFRNYLTTIGKDPVAFETHYKVKIDSCTIKYLTDAQAFIQKGINKKPEKVEQETGDLFDGQHG